MGNEIKVDGALGKNTIKAINSEDSSILFEKYRQNRLKYYDSIINRSINEYKKNNKNVTEEDLLMHTQKRFEKGWKNRTNSIKYEK